MRADSHLDDGARKAIEHRIAQVESAEAADFAALVALAELDPARDFRFFDWSGVDFSGYDLRGFDFTGANLEGCQFAGALIVGARFDAAQVERVALQQAKDWNSYTAAWTPLAEPPSGRHLPDLAVFSDAPFAPEMVVIPAGRFLMGSPDYKVDQRVGRPIGEHGNQGPPHEVVFRYRLAIGRYPVTFEEYDHFCSQTGREKPGDDGWCRSRWPVINVSWVDSRAYAKWLSREIGRCYRLPSEAEWEYACRAGTTTYFSFGDAISPKEANFDGRVGGTSEVGSYPANPWGLHDLHGNVMEWVEDVWHSNYREAPNDGSAWVDGTAERSLRGRVVRGGNWSEDWTATHSAYRSGGGPNSRVNYLGFRLARALS